ncbi:MAG: SsrA-binding protein SmpB [Fimbriimonadaceae bacterium]|nr:SsrA-binding protein SmpB [Fimbriimonadaceae bacterium]
MAKKKASDSGSGPPRAIQNRRARYDYEFLDTFEAGIVLIGSEVKSVWQGNANLTDAYCLFRNGELWLINMDVEPYKHAAHFQPDRRRDRKLLLHRRQLTLIERRAQEKSLALIPSKVYFNHGKVKVEIALAKGKREYDKRRQLAKDETRRDIERARSGDY